MPAYLRPDPFGRTLPEIVDELTWILEELDGAHAPASAATVSDDAGRRACSVRESAGALEDDGADAVPAVIDDLRADAAALEEIAESAEGLEALVDAVAIVLPELTRVLEDVRRMLLAGAA